MRWANISVGHAFEDGSRLEKNVSDSDGEKCTWNDAPVNSGIEWSIYTKKILSLRTKNGISHVLFTNLEIQR